MQTILTKCANSKWQRAQKFFKHFFPRVKTAVVCFVKYFGKNAKIVHSWQIVQTIVVTSCNCSHQGSKLINLHHSPSFFFISKFHGACQFSFVYLHFFLNRKCDNFLFLKNYCGLIISSYIQKVLRGFVQSVGATQCINEPIYAF